jgi:hypothetical protein
MNPMLNRRALLKSASAVAAAAATPAMTGTTSAAAATTPARPGAAVEGEPRVRNLPASFYDRPGLEDMPRIDYESLPVVDVRDHGATGDGVTPDNAAFVAAVAAVQAGGGGIVYVPPGRYLFTEQGDRKLFTATLSNVHFVGEGETSTICLQRPGLDDPRYPTFQGWAFTKASNVSFRGLAFRWSPYFLMRNSTTAYSLVLDGGDQAQFIGVHFDQGQPALWLNQGSHRYVVDCVARNVAADALHFDSISESTAAYNYVEHCYDDGVANVTNTATAPDPSTLTGVKLIGNTVICTPWGRGVTLGGKGQLTEDNWVEGAQSAGIFSSVGIFGNTPSAPLYDSVVRRNTLIRANLAQREDNSFYKFGTGGYQGAFVVMDQIEGLTVEQNRIYGSEDNAVTLGIQGWYVAKAADVVIRDNDLQGASTAGIHMVAGGTVDGLTVTGNRILNTAGASFQVDGALTAVDTAANRVSKSPVVSDTGSVSGNFNGFKVVGTPPKYDDLYAPFRTAADETEWAELPTWPEQHGGLRRVDVRTFGARGDGHTNDTKAFRRAITSLPKEGGVLVVPSGRYRLDPVAGSDTVDNSRIRHHVLLKGLSNVHVEGSGDSSVLIFGSADHHGIRLLDVQDCSVSGLRLELAEQPVLRHNRALLDVSAARNTVVAGITAVGSSGPGVRVDTSRQILVTGCTVRDAGQHGIELASCRQVAVRACTVSGSLDNAIETSWVGSAMLEPQYVVIDGNTVDGTRQGAGVGVVGGNQIVVTGNTVRNTFLAGLYVYSRCSNYPPKHIELTGNTLTGTNSGAFTYTPGAISLHSLNEGRSSGNILATGNVIAGTRYAGLWVGGVTPTGTTLCTLESLTFTGNTITGAGTTDIDISADQRSRIATLTIG